MKNLFIMLMLSALAVSLSNCKKDDAQAPKGPEVIIGTSAAQVLIAQKETIKNVMIDNPRADPKILAYAATNAFIAAFRNGLFINWNQGDLITARKVAMRMGFDSIQEIPRTIKISDTLIEMSKKIIAKIQGDTSVHMPPASFADSLEINIETMCKELVLGVFVLDQSYIDGMLINNVDKYFFYFYLYFYEYATPDSIKKLSALDLLIDLIANHPEKLQNQNTH